MTVHVLNDHRAIVMGRHGMFLINRHDFYVGQALEAYGEYGQLEADILHSFLSDGDIVIEVGANIGSHTVGLAKKVGHRGRVYAYEPQRACYALLQAQIALNQLDQVIAVAAGCGTTVGTFWLKPPEYEKFGNFGRVSLSAEPDEGYESVPVKRLDDAHQGERVRLIKVDVEGMEADVLAGARQLIRDQQPILYLENDRPENSRHLIETVFEMGYKAWWHICPLFNADNYFKHPENIYGKTASLNMVCAPAHMQIDQSRFSRKARLEEPWPWKIPG